MRFISWGMILISLFPQNLVLAAAPKTAADHASTGSSATTGSMDVPSRMNLLMRETWKKAGVTPSEKATDGEFIRRAYLDFLGETPTAEALQEFTNSKNPKKHQVLCKDITRNSRFQPYWATRWGGWLGTENPKSGSEATDPSLSYVAQMLFSEHQFAMDKVVRDLLATKVRVARSQGGPRIRVGLNGNYGMPINMVDYKKQEFLRMHRGENFDMEPVTQKTAHLFLGTQLECAKCHDHPFQKWKQSDYWGLNASLSSVYPNGYGNYLKRTLYFEDAPPATVSYDPSVLNGGSGTVKNEAKPRYLDGKELGKSDALTVREELANRITGDPLFPKAIVNRMWAALFGAGLNGDTPADDFHVNEMNQLEGILHPELLETLAQEFKKSGFRLDTLLGWMCESEAYQLSSRTNPTNESEEKAPLFSRMPLKPLSLGQIHGAISKVSGGSNTKELPEALFEAGFRPASLQGAKDRMVVSQALGLLNNKDIRATLWDSRFAAKEPTASNIHEAFLSTLGRRPTANELSMAAKLSILPRKEGDVVEDVMRLVVDLNFENRARGEFIDTRQELEEKLAKHRRELEPRIRRQVGKYLAASNDKERDTALYVITTAFESDTGTKLSAEEQARLKRVLTLKSNLVDVYAMLFNTTEFTHNH